MSWGTRSRKVQALPRRGRMSFLILLTLLMATLPLRAQDVVPVIAIPRPDLFPGATNPAITPDCDPRQ